MTLYDICFSIVVICATCIAILVVLFIGYTLIHKIVENFDFNLWREWYHKKADELKKKMEKEYEQRLQDETKRILAEMYTRDKATNEEENHGNNNDIT